MTNILTADDLIQFSGSVNYYRHPFVKDFLWSDGVDYMASKAGAYWLIDEIAFSQVKPKVSAEEFQLWRLQVYKSTAILFCEDGNGNKIFSRRIHSTNFPLDEIKLFYANNVLHLPSEY